MEQRTAAWFRRAAAAERAKAAEALARAELWEKTASELEQLKASDQHRKVTSSMEAGHKVALSGARAPKDKFVAALNKAGYSMRSLASEIGVSHPTLMAHRKPRSDKNHRPIPTDRAEKIAAKTGWPADAAHWPAGLSS